MSEEKRADRLKPILRQVERELETRVDEACEVDNVAEETTGELEKLSDTLELAAQSARAAASLRRRIREARLVDRIESSSVEPPTAPPPVA